MRMKVCVALALLGTLCLTGVAATLNTTTRRTLAAPETEAQPLDYRASISALERLDRTPGQ
jgi:hypothetical protein